jgi:hypothetical protein
MKQVKLTIKGGVVSADFTGFQGKSCELLEAKIRPAGFGQTQKELKPEYNFDTDAQQEVMQEKSW